MRQPTESVSTYVAELRSLIEFCGFPAGEASDKMLRDRLVCGINNPGIQRRLLSEDNLDFKKAYDLALAMEAAAKNSRTLQQASNSPSIETPVEDVRKIRKQFTSSKHPQSRTQTATTSAGTCTRCGARNHPASRCKYRTAKCYNCSKVGHIASVCRSRPPVHREDRSKDVKSLGSSIVTPDSSIKDNTYSLFSLPSTDHTRHPITLNVKLDGIPHLLELDTGASVSLISQSTFRKMWPDRNVQPSSVTLKTYTGESVCVLGSVQVKVEHGSTVAELPLLVTKMNGASLIGRNWLNHLQLSVNSINQL